MIDTKIVNETKINAVSSPITEYPTAYLPNLDPVSIAKLNKDPAVVRDSIDSGIHEGRHDRAFLGSLIEYVSSVEANNMLDETGKNAIQHLSRYLGDDKISQAFSQLLLVKNESLAYYVAQSLEQQKAEAPVHLLKVCRSLLTPPEPRDQNAWGTLTAFSTTKNFAIQVLASNPSPENADCLVNLANNVSSKKFDVVRAIASNSQFPVSESIDALMLRVVSENPETLHLSAHEYAMKYFLRHPTIDPLPIASDLAAGKPSYVALDAGFSALRTIGTPASINKYFELERYSSNQGSITLYVANAVRRGAFALKEMLQPRPGKDIRELISRTRGSASYTTKLLGYTALAKSKDPVALKELSRKQKSIFTGSEIKGYIARALE